VRISWQTPYAVAGLPVAGHLNPEASVLGATNQLVAQDRQPLGIPLAVGRGVTHRHGETANGRYVEAPAAHLTLLSSAVGQWHERGVASSQQRADALWTTDLVATDAQQVQPTGGEVNLDLADGLDGVAVHRDGELAGDGDDLGNRLDRSHLVVRPHHTDQRHRLRVGLDRRTDCFGVDPTELVDLEPGDLGALVSFEEVHTVQYGVVLDHADQEANPARIRIPSGPEGALDGEVVRLRAAGGEQHLGGPGTHGLGDCLARLLDHASTLAARGVKG
jgi:hypothetical protein